jgi:hypothetical protein
VPQRCSCQASGWHELTILCDGAGVAEEQVERFFISSRQKGLAQGAPIGTFGHRLLFLLTTLDAIDILSILYLPSLMPPLLCFHGMCYYDPTALLFHSPAESRSCRLPGYSYLILVKTQGPRAHVNQ